MSMPKRLRHGGSSEERKLLSSAFEPSPRLRRALWTRMVATLASAGTVAAATEVAVASTTLAPATATSIATTGLLKVVVASAVIGLGSVSTAWVLEKETARNVIHEEKVTWVEEAPVKVLPAPRKVAAEGAPAAPSAMALPVVSPSVVPPVAVVERMDPKPEAPPSSAMQGSISESPRVERAEPRGEIQRDGVATPGDRASRLREEASLLRGARESLRSGDSQAALERVRAAKARHPDGVLLQETEAITIEALAASGSVREAEDRARQFLRTYPKSPYGQRMQAIVERGN